MNKNVPLPSKRSGALDLLRFFAVLYVFFGHYTDTFNLVYQIVPANLKYMWFSKYATTALLIFFMVSGYVVTMTSIKRNIKEFAISRLSRLYPLFWVSCIVAFIMPRLFYTNHSYLAEASLKTFFVNLTMVPYLFGYPTINPVFHTLLIELVFYFFLAIIIVFKLWNRILIILGSLLALCVYGLFLPGLPDFFIIIPFASGMLFYMISADYASKFILYPLLAVSFMCSFVSAQAQADQLDLYYKGATIIDPWVLRGIITTIYIVFLLISTKVIHIAGRRVYQILGELAYPFYLFHIYFLCFYWFFRNKIQPDVLLFGILSVTIFTSWLINVVLEKPLSSLASRGLFYLTGLFKKKNPERIFKAEGLL